MPLRCRLPPADAARADVLELGLDWLVSRMALGGIWIAGALCGAELLVQVGINRSNFMINPTNCSPFTVSSQGVGDQGTVDNFSSPFQAVNCFSLPFAPKMSITELGGRGVTARSKDPSLAIELNTRQGDANIKSLTVTLPKAFEIDQRHLGNLCDRAELASDQCAGRQPIGEAVTETPLLEKPLKGPVYAVSGFGVLPHLAFILGGQVMLTPEAESSSVQGGRLKTVVPVIPDAPIGHFLFTLFGGKQGYSQTPRISAPLRQSPRSNSMPKTARL